MLTLQLLKLVSTVTSTDVLVFFWPARQAIQFLEDPEDPESCHGPHFNVIHVHFK
jgi:hypothetical protein